MSTLRVPRRGNLALAVTVCLGVGGHVWAATSRPTTTYTVNTTTDAQNGSCATDCTLRDALALAQQVNGTVAFGIGSGHQTITLALGELLTTMPVAIDGTTQPGWAIGKPVIEINCADLPSSSALDIQGGLTTVKGLVIDYCQYGIKIFSAGGNTIQGNYIGTDWTGTVAAGGLSEGIQVAFRNNQIGGTTAAARNVIVAQVAVHVTSDGNQVQGNYINTNAAGSGVLGHALTGISVTGSGNTIGGLGGGNVINAPGNPTGTIGDGILTSHDTGTVIQGNYIGTNAAGTAELLVYNGIHLQSTDSTATGPLIGGTDPGTGNVISGAVNAGIFIDRRSASATSVPRIQGNFIGTDKTGSYELPNKWGIYDVGGAGLIGGTTAAARNVISGNEIGILEQSIYNPRTRIKGNDIGLTSGGLPLGNTEAGIQIGTALIPGGTAQIGGTEAGAGNRIAFSRGVTVYGGPAAILSNSIYSNGENGIDIGGDGVTLTNVPVITSAVTNGAVTRVKGTLNGATIPIGAFRLEFFSNSSCGLFPEGKTFVGSTSVTTDFNGDASFDVVLSGVAPVGQFLTATATSLHPSAPDFDNTWEFSACVAVTGGTPTPTDTPTGSPTPTPTRTPTRTPTPTATKTPAPSNTPTTTPVTGTATPSPSSTPTATPSQTATVTRTANATPTPTATRTPTPVPIAFMPHSILVDLFPSTTSNGDGVLEPGETLELKTSWENITGSTLSPDSTTTADPSPPAFDLIVVDPTADYGPIGSAAFGSCLDCEDVEFLQYTPRTNAHLDVRVKETMSSGDSWTWELHVGNSFSDVPPPPSPPPVPTPPAHVVSHATVSGNPFYAKVETLLHNGVTGGCTPTTYCPGDPVTRGQMAIFIAKVMAGGGANVPSSGTANGKPYNCAAGGASVFTDVSPTDLFCKHAHYLAVQNVTLGCSATQFCPGDNVNRESMAAFLAKAIVAPGGGPAVPLTYTDPTTSLAYNCSLASPAVHFTDVPETDTFCKHVHYLWAKGIIGGCGTTTYCPAGGVARDAMAKFLVNAFNLKLYAP